MKIKDGIMIMEKSATTILELLPLTIMGSLLSERFKEKRLRILTDFDVHTVMAKTRGTASVVKSTTVIIERFLVMTVRKKRLIEKCTYSCGKTLLKREEKKSITSQTNFFTKFFFLRVEILISILPPAGSM